ncbi:hypothetical protein AC578_8276 [Pseudocercospora eumusae]|uniref:AsqO/PenF-like C-terminal domain-containing protein n=1 Tax=Pseudocercospora eumusae TaxID=321146 RepID=A0A139HE89_9PEZI|nr:hypothetical protein AC578_8276 [Pseudocercospora eumusae]
MSVDFLGGQGDVSFDTTSTLHPELEYYLRIESPGSGVRGSLSMTWPRVPPHFACDLDDELLVHSHGIAWSNAITDSDANLELSVGNEKLSWSDTVYHDRVWATAYISPENQQSFYWGRGRLGDRCNVIWSSVREQDGKMTNSGSVAADGEIHSAGCECEAVQVKAWAEEGKQSPSPPMPKTPVPVRIAITADLGEENGELCLPLGSSLSIDGGGETLEEHAGWEIAQLPQA